MCELLLITLPVKEQITVTETWQMIFGNFAWMRSLTLKGSKVNADTFLLLKDVSKYLFKRINQIPNLFIYVLWPDDFYNFFLFTLLVLQNIHPHFPLPEQWYTTTLSRKTKYLQPTPPWTLAYYHLSRQTYYRFIFLSFKQSLFFYFLLWVWFVWKQRSPAFSKTLLQISHLKVWAFNFFQFPNCAPRLLLSGCLDRFSNTGYSRVIFGNWHFCFVYYFVNKNHFET